MKLSEILKISMTFIGTIIGAGFASGKEIALYFGKLSPVVPILAGAAIGFFAFLFAELGRRTEETGDILTLLFRGVASPVRKFIELANYVTFIAMIAGAELVLRDSFSVAGGGVFSALLAFAILLKGNDGMKYLNTALVPVIIVAVAGLSYFAPAAPNPQKLAVSAPIAYASMNLLTGGYLIGNLTKKTDVRENAAIGLLVGIVSSALLFLLHRIVLLRPDAPMPVGAFASELGLGLLSGVLIYLSILTTMVSSLRVTSEGKTVRSLFAIALGFLLSLAGFETLVDRFYPIIGYAGVFLAAAALWYLSKKEIFNRLFPKRKPRKPLRSSRRFGKIPKSAGEIEPRGNDRSGSRAL